MNMHCDYCEAELIPKEGEEQYFMELKRHKIGNDGNRLTSPPLYDEAMIPKQWCQFNCMFRWVHEALQVPK